MTKVIGSALLLAILMGYAVLPLAAAPTIPFEPSAPTILDFDLPNVTTSVPVEINPTRARGGGDIISTGTSPVTAFGVCWAMTQAPDFDDTCADGTGSGTGVFVADIIGLDPATPYYVRAYATNSSGTRFGNEVGFSTREVVTYVNRDGVCNNNTPCFDMINVAIVEAIPGTEIRILAGIYIEDVVLATDKTVKLSGGWDTRYAEQIGTSTIKTLTIEKGGVTTDNIILQNF
jgi:hypothetical protein